MDNFTIAVIIGAAAVCFVFGLLFFFDSKKPEPVPAAPAPPPAPVKPSGPVKPARKRSA
jgi:hypothetical protein